MNYIKPIPKGTVVLFSSGEYSDYNVEGLMRAKQDINPEAVRDEYMSQFPEEMLKYTFHQENFLNFLKEKDLFEPLKHPDWMEWFLGSYSTADMRVYEGPLLFT